MAAHQTPLSLGFSRQEHWSGLPFPSPMHESKKWKWSSLVVSDPQWPHGLQPSRLLRPWDFPGKSTGVGCHCLLQFFSTPTLFHFSSGYFPESMVSFQLLFTHSVKFDSLWPLGLQHTGFPSFTISWSLLKLMSIKTEKNTYGINCLPYFIIKLGKTELRGSVAFMCKVFV